ncbi:single-stranded DNA-binding protein [Olsenella profusa]|uniref:Single-stranded DNA-binding protein n=1 Tax=Olsenella profusa F0195 TaxID=1125712 RepID=U2V349_9ACTN|nr:single-stranded DNA-binding protein [Olsenella profusa]ERL09757.1 single-stranded DNA-binding protein [Olsenella profusa F0195]
MSINVASISGNLGANPELRQTSTGTQVLSMRVAVNDRVRQQDGTWADRPNWIGVVVFGNRAGALSGMLHKGSKVSVSGRLRYSEWQDSETGKKRSKVEVVADDIEFLSPRSDAPAYAPQHQQPAPAYQQAPQEAPQYQQAYARQPQVAPAPAPQYQQPAAAPAPQPAAAPAPQAAPQPGLYDDEIPF